jgi:hypothetical protein
VEVGSIAEEGVVYLGGGFIGWSHGSLNSYQMLNT